MTSCRATSDLPVEVYTPERKAEFLLANAIDEDDLAWAEEEVRRLGLDPADFWSPGPRSGRSSASSGE